MPGTYKARLRTLLAQTNDIDTTVYVDQPYAAAVHEWTHIPHSTGTAKYLEVGMKNASDAYHAVLARHMLGSRGDKAVGVATAARVTVSVTRALVPKDTGLLSRSIGFVSEEGGAPLVQEDPSYPRRGH